MSVTWFCVTYVCANMMYSNVLLIAATFYVTVAELDPIGHLVRIGYWVEIGYNELLGY